MDIALKLKILEEMYRIYGEFLQERQFACEKYCDSCCTRNVTMTTLEGFHIIQELDGSKRSELMSLIRSQSGLERFQPLITTNQMASMCARGEDLPEEDPQPDIGPCPALSDRLCPLYQSRPFGCRCMVSISCCEQTGYAEMDPLVLSVNDVFLQYIEQIDVHGFSGNFMDVLLFLESEKNRGDYTSGRINKPGEGSGLIPNYPVYALMVPPEHRNEIAPILERLRSINPAA